MRPKRAHSARGCPRGLQALLTLSVLFPSLFDSGAPRTMKALWLLLVAAAAVVPAGEHPHLGQPALQLWSYTKTAHMPGACSEGPGRRLHPAAASGRIPEPQEPQWRHFARAAGYAGQGGYSGAIKVPRQGGCSFAVPVKVHLHL